MATETVAGNDILPTLPEPQVNEEILTNENDETTEAPSEAPIQDDAVSVRSIDSNYQPEVILNVLTLAVEYTPTLTRLAMPRQSEQFFTRRGGRYQRNRWQEFKKLVQRHAKEIRNTKYCLFALTLLMVLSITAMVISLEYITSCRKSTTIIMFLSGVVGFLLITCRLVTVFIRNFFISLRGKEPTAVSKALFLGLLTLFISGMIVFYIVPPVFDPASEDYCAEDFYYYNHHMNIAVSCILFLVVLLHIPDYL